MSGRGGLAWLALAALALGSSSSSSSSSSSGPTPSGPTPSGPTPSEPVAGGDPPTAPRTGLDGRDAWSRYAREVEQLARAALAAEGATDVEQLIGAHALAALALSETSGRSEYGYNPGNLRPVGDQPRARWPNGVLYRAFASRADGVRELARILRRGSRYRDAWAQLVELATQGEPVEPLVGAWFGAVHERGYTDGPSDPAARPAWLARQVETGTRCADLVSRALAMEPQTGAVRADGTPSDGPGARIVQAAQALYQRLRGTP